MLAGADLASLGADLASLVGKLSPFSDSIPAV
jgi:hypothetical protein